MITRADCRLETQPNGKRWKYLMHIPGERPYPSSLHWTTEARAREVGETRLTMAIEEINRELRRKAARS